MVKSIARAYGSGFILNNENCYVCSTYITSFLYKELKVYV